VSVLGLTNLEVTSLQVVLACRMVKILAACLSISRPIIIADLTASFEGELIADHFGRRHESQTRGGELGAEHMTGKVLSD
jgi:hypothetical protein